MLVEMGQCTWLVAALSAEFATYTAQNREYPMSAHTKTANMLGVPVAAPLPNDMVMPAGADVEVVACARPSQFVGVARKPPGLRVNRATMNDFGRQRGDAAHACCSWIDETPRTEREILALAGYTRNSWSQLFCDLIDEGHAELSERKVCSVSKRLARTYVRPRK
jgi:hypothetical protein